MAIKKEFSASMSEEAEASMLNGNFQEIDNKFRTNVIKDKTGTPRVLIGEQADGFGSGDDYGIKVSQAGSDVTTTTDDNLVMSSAFNMFKIVQSGTTTLTIGNPAPVWTYETVTVNHNLGYKPASLVYAEFPAGLGSTLIQVPYVGIDGGTGATGISIRPDVDDNDLTIAVATSGAAAYDGETITFRYYLLRETAD